MRPLLSALLLVAASLFAVATPQAPRGPLTKAEVLDLVRSSVPSQVVAEAVQRYGIAFEPTEPVLEELRKTGAGDVLVRAMRDSWRRDPAKPMSEQDIVLLLAGDVRSERLVEMVRQRGVGFDPTDEYFSKLRANGATDEIIAVLRLAAEKPLGRDRLLQSLADGEDAAQVAKGLKAYGIDFDPGEDDFVKLRGVGAPESLLQTVRDAKRVKPAAQSSNVPEPVPVAPPETSPLRGPAAARIDCPPSATSIPVFANPKDLNTIFTRLDCGDHIAVLEEDSGKTGFDKIILADGKEGFVEDSYLNPGSLVPPSPSSNPEPAYTPQAQRDKVEGNVDIWIVVDSQGKVTDAQEFSKPLGDGLDEKAVETVKTWKFKPATQDGVPVAVRVIVEVAFRLVHR